MSHLSSTDEHNQPTPSPKMSLQKCFQNQKWDEDTQLDNMATFKVITSNFRKAVCVQFRPINCIYSGKSCENLTSKKKRKRKRKKRRRRDPTVGICRHSKSSECVRSMYCAWLIWGCVEKWQNSTAPICIKLDGKVFHIHKLKEYLNLYNNTNKIWTQTQRTHLLHYA